jgi:hypothetical protein
LERPDNNGCATLARCKIKGLQTHPFMLEVFAVAFMALSNT